MTSFKLICFVIFMLNVLRIRGEISDKRMCADSTCSEPIATAKTLIKYSSPELGVLSFPANADITIYSKEAGKNTNLWGAEYNGKRGYVPRLHIREIKILKKKAELIYLQDTEFKTVPLSNVIPPPAVLVPNKVQEAYEVVDGTTIYTDEPITPSNTERPVLALAAVSETPTVPTDKLEPTPDFIDNTIVKNEEIVPVPTTEGSMFGNIVNSLLGNSQDDEADDEGVDYEDDDDEGGVEEEDSEEDEDVEANIKKGIEESEIANNLKIKEEILETKEQLEKMQLAKNNNDKVMELDMKEINNINEVLMANADEIIESNLDEIAANIPLFQPTTEIPNNEIPSPEIIDTEAVTFDPLIENQYDPYKIIKEASNTETIENVPKNNVGGGFNYLHNRNIVEEIKTVENVDAINYHTQANQNIPPIQDIIPIINDNVANDASNFELNKNIPNINPPEINANLPAMNENVSPIDVSINNIVPTINETAPIIGNVPIINENLPIIAEIEPAINENVHAMKDNVATIDEPTINENVETINENVPTIIENVAQINENIPKLNENIPTMHENVPTITENEAIINGNIPTINENVPIFNENIQSINENIPIINENVPSLNENVPTLNKNVPTLNNIVPTINENVQTLHEILPTINENVPTLNENVPKLNENVPTLNENVPTLNENVPMLNENVPTLNENVPTLNEIVPTIIENVPRINETAPIISENIPEIKEKVPTMNENIPIDADTINENVAAVNEIIPNIPTIYEDNSIINNLHEIKENINENLASNTNIPIPENIAIDIPIIAQTEEQINEPAKESHDSIYNYFDKGEKKVEATQNMGTVESVNYEEPTSKEDVEEAEIDDSPGFFSRMFDMFGGSSKADEANPNDSEEKPAKLIEIQEIYEENNKDVLVSKPTQETPQDATCLYDPSQSHCFSEDNPNLVERTEPLKSNEDLISESTGINIISMDGGDIINLLVVLSVTGITILIFLWGNIVIDKTRKEAPLVNKINNLEKSVVILQKEKQLLSDKISYENDTCDQIDAVSNERIGQLMNELDEANNARNALEEQVQSLEKELENSTEVGMELNRMLTDILSSQNGSDTLMSNVEQLQRQLVEQQSTINAINASLNEKDLENHEIQLELEINNKKVVDLQSELDKMVFNLLKVEEEKEQVMNKNDFESNGLRNKLKEVELIYISEKNKLMSELNELKINLKKTQRNYELKSNEYNVLKDNLKDIKGSKDKTETLRSLLDVSSVKAELQQLKRDNQQLTEHLAQELQGKYDFEKQASAALQDVHVLRQKYDEADKEKFEALTKLEVLGNYFKEKETQLQKELSKHENMWIEKQGEATSTTERIKFMQGEVQNFKAQNESLKQEIVSQEVELKSQISLLEKKAHENWVHARQAERKFEDSRQEAAQLRNRLTLRERSFNEDKSHNRILSPLETNGDHHHLSPLHMNDSTSPPPLLFGNHEHMPTSPQIPGLPPFLPPPGGMPGFMPPPLPGVPPFMPPPPNMFPGDHRPPPLGRMSSPPINSRYSPDSRPYSPYDRNSPSPTDDDYYGPPHRGYSPYNNGRDDRDRRDYNRPPPPRNNFRNNKGGAMSSGSANSNESLERINRHNSKV